MFHCWNVSLLETVLFDSTFTSYYSFYNLQYTFNNFKFTFNLLILEGDLKRRNPVARRKLFVDEDTINFDSDNIDVDYVSVHNVDNNVGGNNVGGHNVDDNVGGDNVGGHNVDDNVGGDNFDGENVDDVKDEKNVEKKNHGFKNSNDVVPYVGKIFDTLDDAEAFYRNYGRKEGFEIIIRNTHKRTNINEPSYRLFICRKGGRVGATPLDFGKGKRVREVIPRTNCGARMCVVHKMKMDKWQISSVDLEHNHKLVSPEKVQFFQRSLNIDPMTRSLIELFNKSGIETGKVMKFLSETKGGVENLGFSNQDVRNVIHDENRVRGLVWVDPRSMNAYKNFGDVVTFDSTYRMNRYCMPFIPITGVNHHYQNILFGFALVRDETEVSYKWVLRTWLEAVDNKPPRTIITDQDIALGNAIAEVMPMPQTKHTYCTWHISSKFPEKLSYLYTNYPEFKTEFNACVYKSLTPTEFEGKWEQLVEKYDLEDHAWLNDMYAIRTQWIGAYTKQHFSAGMTTTSRSESTNFFFDEYMQSSTGLKEFIEELPKGFGDTISEGG
ncbi:protein FAR1-RELATED SEQUENCE 5-like [Apium graveolens]|uniref:protein FAR1-RELATED SEQUENCE 5-like n=1 Tax=Apium graveolens TaxID=4045 RepID=UPI003D7A2AA1